MLYRVIVGMAPVVAGCSHAPHVCLTPPYDAPGGFSETYHAAVFRDPAAFAGGSVLPAEGPTIVGPPIFVWPDFRTSAQPPMEW